MNQIFLFKLCFKYSKLLLWQDQLKKNKQTKQSFMAKTAYVMKPLHTATSSGDYQSLHTLQPGSACPEIPRLIISTLLLMSWGFHSRVVHLCFAKVYQTCGTPGETSTGSPALQEQRKKSSLTATEYKPSPTAGVRLAMQVGALSSGLYRNNLTAVAWSKIAWLT